MTPDKRTIQRIILMSFANPGLPNLCASHIFTIVFMTTAMMIATVAVRLVRAWLLPVRRADLSAISCVIASTSARPDMNATI